MEPIKFPEQNCTFVADGCNDLPVAKTHNEEFSADEMISLWVLSDDDLVTILEQIKSGIRPSIHLSVIGGQPPVKLWVRE